MEILFEGKRAVVTGAGQGIGRAVAKRLSNHGATVFALSKTKENLDSLKLEDPKINTIVVNLADWDATKIAVESIGQVDLLVNNAAILILKEFLDITPEDFDKLLNVNLKAVMNVSQIVAKSMIASQTAGSIVNVSSLASLHAVPGFALYGAGKAGLNMLSKVMALELGKHNIRVNCVNPTAVMTAMGKIGFSDPTKAAPIITRTPLKRIAEVEEVVDVIVYLLSDKSSMINATTVPIEGGYSSC